MTIKTIVEGHAKDFDTAVNKALSEGYLLVQRGVIDGHHYAQMEKYDAVTAVDEVKEHALALLYRELKRARISLGNAESKQNNADEVANLNKKIASFEWLIGLAIKGD